MSERAEALREVIADAAWQTLPEGERGGYVARAICEHLGWTWVDVAQLREMAASERERDFGGASEWMDEQAERVATLLKAGGIER